MTSIASGPTASTTTAPDLVVEGASSLPVPHRLDDWRPEDPAFWAGTGRTIALRNLAFSVFSEHVGFSVWSLWSVLVLFLGPKYHVDAAGKFLLTSTPAAVGSVLRIPYSFAVTRFGGRNWTVFSALLLLVPCIFLAVVLKPGVSYSTLMISAAIAGVGGANFASSMTNINLFFPDKEKGWALGLNAGGGNLGVAFVQLVGLAVLSWAGISHPRLMFAVYLPLIVLSALLAFLFMDNISGVRGDSAAMKEAVTKSDTWLMSFLYIGTFGSFIGYSFAFGQVLQVTFHYTPRHAAALTFLGPLVGSLVRPLGGMLADRFRGSRVTVVVFLCMAASTLIVLAASKQKSLGLFEFGFILLFAFSGLGNGSTYKMIPSIFAARAVQNGEPPTSGRRLSGAVIGIAGAIGGLGGVAVNVAFRQSFLANHNANAAYVGFACFYLVAAFVAAGAYVRTHRLAGI